MCDGIVERGRAGRRQAQRRTSRGSACGGEERGFREISVRDASVPVEKLELGSSVGLNVHAWDLDKPRSQDSTRRQCSHRSTGSPTASELTWANRRRRSDVSIAMAGWRGVCEIEWRRVGVVRRGGGGEVNG